MYSGESLPLLSNCKFIENVARNNGGGIYSQNGSDVEIASCVFNGNQAGQYGGGMRNVYSSPIVTDCVFSRNSATVGGGGMSNYESSPYLTGNCSFSGNSARFGGGIFNSDNSDPAVANCTFNANRADFGGGIANQDSSSTVTNCTFSANSAAEWGGGMRNLGSYSAVENCTFYDNSARWGGGGMQNYESRPILVNCIFWGDAPDEINASLGNLIMSYCDVQGSWQGKGNVNVNPLFADPVNGDYHLKSQAGRWDPASQGWVIDGLTSPCIDAGDPASPVGLEPAPNGGRINMGAYGGTAEASKSLLP